jgi:hypothetical protein
MSKENLQALLIILGVLLLLGIFTTDYQKTKCLEDGGRWISGFFGGTYAHLCLPKDTF